MLLMLWLDMLFVYILNIKLSNMILEVNIFKIKKIKYVYIVNRYFWFLFINMYNIFIIIIGIIEKENEMNR